jgi:membrane fusion protein (multidrug efflux system)
MKRHPISFSILLCTACSGGTEGPGKKRPPTKIKVAAVEMQPFSDELVALGTLRANESIDVTANVTEKVARVRFRDGERVEAGQVLVELVRNEEVSEIDRARAELSREAAELARVETLAADEIATPSELDTQRTRVHTSRAALRALEARLGDRLVRAPFAGVVGLRQVSAGSLVTPTTVITTLDAIDTLLADLPVPERYLGQIAAGQQVTLFTDAFPEAEIDGEVIAIDGRVDATTRAIMVRAQVTNPVGKLRPGMLVRATIAAGEHESPAVPESAVVQRAARAFVYTIIETATPVEVRQVEIEIGRRRPGWVEVVAGVATDERVVIEGTNRVRPGAVVEIVE